MHKELWISMDVLQLIALSYGLGYAVTSLKSPVRWIVPSLALVAYGLVLSHLSYPGATGVVDAENNPIAWFNQQYLKAWKFEGLLSVIPGTVIVVIGCAAMENVKKGSKLSRNAAGGLALVVVGWVWSFDLTFSKQFWTPSYILVCSGLGVLLLSLFQVVDARPWFRAATWPFAVFGANPLVAYVLPILVKLTLLTWIVVPYRGESLSLVDALLKTSIDSFGRIPGGWVYTIVYILVAWLIVVALNLRGAFVRA